MSQQELATAYQPAAIERRWYETWEQEGLFRAAVDGEKKAYSIVIPPPNVTGALHIGHAFGHTLQDAFIRRARMMGFEALWLPGTDHAGIATQNVVERQLANEGLDRHELGREEFVERVWAWKKQYGGTILEQMRRLGNSCDWDRERFTMDEGLSRAVRTVFVRWFDEGLIYRGLRIINWCPYHETALSDVEVEHEDAAGEIITFIYKLVDGEGEIPVATTRIETMLGDTGIAVHPSDDRYSDLVGRRVVHPFFPDRDIPIVADDAVDPEFGTGAVKVTPAHDPTDFEIGERQGLAKINIFDGQAKTTAEAGPFAGLDRYEARKQVFEELDKLGFVVKHERPYMHPVGHCYRCRTEIEPWLSEQWFVEMKPLVEPALEAVRDGRIRIEPKRFVKAYADWMENIRDWCISRQIWWGHRIPVWYCDDCGETFAALEDPVECKKCASASLRQDPDVLDTWFSSQLWPFSTLGWPDETPDLEFFYPTQLMATGYEILYLWVARMITSGLYFMGDVPFREVLIHGIVRDFEGKKMSKSIGNVIDPLDMIDLHGADALRFSLAFAAVPGNDTNASEDRIEGARNFANKLWNASRFVLLSIDEERPPLPEEDRRAVEDRWILSRLDATVRDVEMALDSFNWAEACKSLHRFVRSEFCDWYIELAKLRLDGPQRDVVVGVLVHVLDSILRLLHPVMPFVTEELWSRLRPEAGSIMRADWPVPEELADDEAERLMSILQEAVVAIRKLKADHEIAQRKQASVKIMPKNEVFADLLHQAEDLLGSFTHVDVQWNPYANGSGEPGVQADKATAHIVTPSGIQISLDVAGIKDFDFDVERQRLEKQLAQAEDTIGFTSRKLENESFISKAPDAVVDKERRKLAEASELKQQIESQLQALG